MRTAQKSRDAEKVYTILADVVPQPSATPDRLAESGLTEELPEPPAEVEHNVETAAAAAEAAETAAAEAAAAETAAAAAETAAAEAAAAETAAAEVAAAETAAAEAAAAETAAEETAAAEMAAEKVAEKANSETPAEKAQKNRARLKSEHLADHAEDLKHLKWRDDVRTAVTHPSYTLNTHLAPDSIYYAYFALGFCAYLALSPCSAPHRHPM